MVFQKPMLPNRTFTSPIEPMPSSKGMEENLSQTLSFHVISFNLPIARHYSVTISRALIYNRHVQSQKPWRNFSSSSWIWFLKDSFWIPLRLVPNVNAISNIPPGFMTRVDVLTWWTFYKIKCASWSEINKGLGQKMP